LLISALLDGPLETPLWKTFLDRLRDMTGASYATLIVRPPSRQFKEAIYLFSGPVQPAKIDAWYRKYTHTLDADAPETHVEGRAYSLGEILTSLTSEHRHLYQDLFAANGITDIRQMYVAESLGVGALLTIAREGKKFGAKDNALLNAIAPVLRGVLRLYVSGERERFAASLTADAIRRLQFGWIALDATGQIVECDEQGALVLSKSGVLKRSGNNRLVATPKKLEREIYSTLQRMVDDPRGRSRAIPLARDPWLDMLLVPGSRKSISAKAPVAAITYVHGDSWHMADRCEQLAELFGLSSGEARLALALSRGMTIAEAASAFGLTVETARSYSKDIYAKTGARGLPDLVRIVMRSVLAIAPDA
jgi:DNA-binding CsgD family transcriptional regulator